MRVVLLLLILVLASQVQAASLVWDDTADGQFDVEYSETLDGPFRLELRVPANPPKYPLVTGKFGYYRLHTEAGYSNVALYSLDVESDKMVELEARVTALEKPVTVTVTNIIAKQLDANRIEVIGQACTSLKTTGSGLKRIIECIK